MQTNINKLRGKIAEVGITNEAVAAALSVDYSTFYRKMKDDGLSFTVGQMHKLVDVLSLTADEAMAIFLSNSSQ